MCVCVCLSVDSVWYNSGHRGHARKGDVQRQKNIVSVSRRHTLTSFPLLITGVFVYKAAWPLRAYTLIRPTSVFGTCIMTGMGFIGWHWPRAGLMCMHACMINKFVYLVYLDGQASAWLEPSRMQSSWTSECSLDKCNAKSRLFNSLLCYKFSDSVRRSSRTDLSRLILHSSITCHFRKSSGRRKQFLVLRNFFESMWWRHARAIKSVACEKCKQILSATRTKQEDGSSSVDRYQPVYMEGERA